MTAAEYKSPRKRTTLTGRLRYAYQPQANKAHKWIHRNYGKALKCENDPTHTTTKFEWANLSYEYKLDISDWKQLCPSCHRKMDMTDEQKAFMKTMNLGRPAHNRRPVTQLDKTGKELRTFSHIHEASDKTGIIRTSIMNVLAGRAKTAGGYQWRVAS